MNVKVRNGTPDFALAGRGGLCVTCKYATIINGVMDKHKIVRCAMGFMVTFPVVECRKYLHNSHPFITELEELAWVITTDVKTKQIGFVKVKDMAEEQRMKYINSPPNVPF